MLLLMASVLGVEALRRKINKIKIILFLTFPTDLENPQSGNISPSPPQELVLELEREMELQELLSEDSTSPWLFQEMEGEGWVRRVLVL